MKARFAYAFVLGVLASVASCSSFGNGDDDGDPSPPDAGVEASADAIADAPSTEDVAPGDDGGGSIERFCLRALNKLNRECDDFQTGPLLEAPWRSTLTTQVLPPNAAALAPNNGDVSARFTVPAMPGPMAAYLQHDLGVRTKTTITFGMTFQITGFGPDDYVEISQLSAAAGGVGIALSSDVLELYVSDGPSAYIALDPRERHRLVVEVTSSGVKARDLTGTIATIDSAFDGGLPTSGHLGVGIYYSTKATVTGTVDIDDVVIDY